MLANSIIFEGVEIVRLGLTAGEESIELDQELDVWVITLCDLSVRVLDVVVVETKGGG